MRKKAAYLFTESYIFYFSISTISQKATHALKIQKKMKKRSERRKHSARAGCSKVRTPPARSPARPLQTHKRTNAQTGPITIHCAAAS